MSDPVVEFERAFSQIIRSKYAIAVNSGTSALHAALVACDVRGGEVIMPALCPAMDAFAIIHAGATPVFADVDPLTHLVTESTLVRCVTPNTKAIIAVALHGLPCDMDPIKRMADSWGIYVIEDCAQALLARYKDGYAGTKADFGCFSFEKKKHMTTGSEGGMIVTNNEKLAIKARKFAGIGYKHMTAEAGRTSLSAATYQRPDYERFDTIGLNYRLSHCQADIGMRALENIGEVILRRQMIGYIWQETVGEQLQPHNYDADNTFYSAAWVCKDRDWLQVYQDFHAAGGDNFYALPQIGYHEPAFEHAGWLTPMTPANAVILQKQTMCLKTHYATIEEAQRQAKIFKQVLTR